MGIDLIVLLKTIGYFGFFGILFAESGLFIGFFLPGDSLAFTAGFLASQGFFDIRILLVGAFLAAVAGDSVGYAFGKKIGPAIFKKENSLLFHKDNLERSQKFYERHGGKTIILARFMPVVRTFAPILAGVGKMDYKKFLFFNVIGGFLWAVGLTAAGNFFGSIIPNADKYILPIVLLIVIVSLAPSVYHVLKTKEYRDKIFSVILKYKFFVYLAGVLLAILLILFAWSGDIYFWRHRVCFEKNCFNVETSVTAQEKEKGLMERVSLPQNAGMLFVYGDDDIRRFWMKNTLIPLDIIWLDKNKQIIFIKHSAEPCLQDPSAECPIIFPMGVARYVLEINSGISQKINLKEGDQAKFKGIIL